VPGDLQYRNWLAIRVFDQVDTLWVGFSAFGLLVADTIRLASCSAGSGTTLIEAYHSLIRHAQALIAQVGTPLSNIIHFCAQDAQSAYRQGLRCTFRKRWCAMEMVLLDREELLNLCALDNV
jgi:hypothetical protein